MSRTIATMVYGKAVGSAHRKAILAYLADVASDDGSGIWCSKQTIAAETEIARSTVFKTVNDLVEEGILRPVGTRKCVNGSTIVYALDLSVIRSLPDARKPAGPVREPDPSGGRTSPGEAHPSGSRTPPVREPDGKTSGSRTQTVLEPSLNQKDSTTTTSLSTPPARDVVVSEDREDDWGFYNRVLSAAKLNPSDIPGRYWMPPAAVVEVGRWRVMPKMTDARILECVAAEAKRFTSPPNGPKAFEHALTRLSQALVSGPPKPRPGPGKPDDLAAKRLRWQRIAAGGRA